ncbi:unnamed protein product, partial [Phaeothamnion confervicola]
QQALELNTGLGAMHRFLLSHFDDYVDFNRGAASYASTMTDSERDVIDQQATAFVATCGRGIDGLKALLLQRQQQRRQETLTAAGNAAGTLDGEEDGNSTLAGSGIRPESREAHEHAAITFLFERLKGIAALAEAMQGERQRLSWLAKGRLLSAAEPARGAAAGGAGSVDRAAFEMTPEEQEEEQWLREACRNAYAADLSGPAAVAAPLLGTTAPPSNSAAPSIRTSAVSARSRTPPRPAAAVAATAGSGAARVAAEDERNGSGDRGAAGVGGERWLALEQENSDLAAHLKSELDDVRQVEGRMSEITGLFNLFASKVVQQQDEVAHIYDAAIAVNDTVRRGGQHLDKAAERTGSFCKFYVIFMLAMSFSLLFLHVFNP